MYSDISRRIILLIVYGFISMELLSSNGIIILAMAIYDNFLWIFQVLLFRGEEALRCFCLRGMWGLFFEVLGIFIIHRL
jgi:hypothetical protein